MYKYAFAFQYQRVIEELITQYFRLDPFLLSVPWNQLLQNRRIALVPVPMTKKKESNRGFSPAFELTVVLARILSKRYEVQLQVFPSLLTKNDDTEVQAHKNRRQRLLSLQRTYSVNEVAVSEFCSYEPQALIVVDDILTTGATTTVVIEQVAKSKSIRELLKNKPIIRFTFANA